MRGSGLLPLASAPPARRLAADGLTDHWDGPTKVGSHQQVLHSGGQYLVPSLSARIHGPGNPEKAEWLE